MSLPIVDCRNLIEFCRAFDRHNSVSSTSSRPKPPPPFSHHQLFCHRSPLAAIDLIILLLVLGSLGFLFLPYFAFLFCQVLPLLHAFVTDIILDAPLPYFIGLLGVVFAALVWEIIVNRLRRCSNSHCKGLRRAVEYDIQLESEDCVKYDTHDDDNGVTQLELGRDRKELEAELKKMAPLNGRTVLIFRAPCGCPAGRLEVWGPKKIRRIKK